MVITVDPLRFKRLTIEQLFGSGSPLIDISFKLGERVTVLHGRNGSGKTITLGLIYALREGHYAELRRYPFKKFNLELSDGTTLTIAPTTVSERKPAKRDERTATKSACASLRYRILNLHGTVEEENSLPETEELLEANAAAVIIARRIARDIPGLIEVGPEIWFDERRGVSISIRDILRRYGGEHRAVPLALKNEQKSNPVLSSLLARLPPVKLIKADRLFIRSPDIDPTASLRMQRQQHLKSGLMVERLSEDIRALVMQADRDYRLISTRLDSSLPTRIFKHHKDIPSLDELRVRSRALRDQATRLKELGLLKEEPDTLEEEAALTEDQKSTFFIILKDREEKLSPFAGVVDKAQHLLQSLRGKLAPKSVRLDVETGYQILTAAGTSLPLHCLSSGEQHELVLLHELLFDVQPGSLILIDEPELSLHVTWQKDVLPELLEIAQLSDLDFVLATHSTYIVGDRSDLMVRLGEPV